MIRILLSKLLGERRWTQKDLSQFTGSGPVSRTKRRKFEHKSSLHFIKNVVVVVIKFAK